MPTTSHRRDAEHGQPASATPSLRIHLNRIRPGYAVNAVNQQQTVRRVLAPPPADRDTVLRDRTLARQEGRQLAACRLSGGVPAPGKVPLLALLRNTR